MDRTFCLLIGLSTLLLGSEQFWFSYKMVTANGASIAEEKNLTPVMVYTETQTQYLLCTLELRNDGKVPLEAFLKKNFDTLIPCFYPLSSHVLSWNTKTQNAQSDRVELVIAPVRFTVVFKDEFATINAFR